MIRKTECGITDREIGSMGGQTRELDLAIAKLQEIVLDGLRHGFFECTVVGDTIQGQKRRLMIKAGKGHRFVIPPEDLDPA